MKTLDFTIPAYEKETVEKMVKKASKRIPDVSVKFSKPYEKAYKHTVFENATDMFTRKQITLMHEVIDMTLTLPDSNGWVLKCEYEEGVPHIVDMTKPLDIKIAGHGENYGKCDYCGHKAWAKSYLIENTETGEEMQVGSECMKTFGITKLVWVEKLMRSLYEALDYTQEEHFDYDFDDVEHWHYKKDPYAKRSVKVSDCIRSAKLYYEQNNGKWVGGEWRDRHYEPSLSKAELHNLIVSGEFSENATDEYVDSVLAYVKNEIEPTAVKAFTEWDSDFSWNMCETLKNYYCSIANCAYAFFAVKKYEQWLAASKLSKIDKGEFVHVIGIVTSHRIEEGYYGKYDCYEIKANSGHTIRRNGKIPTDKGEDGIERAEFYAEVEYLHKNGILSIGRATKKPKKGIQYINL